MSVKKIKNYWLKFQDSPWCKVGPSCAAGRRAAY
jgi:hypothetical protein